MLSNIHRAEHKERQILQTINITEAIKTDIQEFY